MRIQAVAFYEDIESKINTHANHTAEDNYAVIKHRVDTAYNNAS